MIEPENGDAHIPRTLVGAHILIVEDSDDLCRSYSRSLPRLGCTFDIAHDVDEAMERVVNPSTAFHAALLDLGVPGDPGGTDLGGLSLIEPLRDRSSPCFSVIVSAQGEHEAVESAMRRRGAVDFVHKPFSFGSSEFTRPLVRAVEQSEATCAALGHPLHRSRPSYSDLSPPARVPAPRAAVDLGGLVDVVLPGWKAGERVTEATVLMLLGFNDRDMGSAMGVSQHTARTHGMRVLQQSGMLHRRDAVRMALERDDQLAREALSPFLRAATLQRTIDLLSAKVLELEATPRRKRS